MYKVLLATPSIIYAPLYLAKALNLSKEFADVEFDYPGAPKNRKKDPLIDTLLLKENDDVICTVCDPMRILFSDSLENNTHAQPYVVGSLITKPLAWIVGNKEKIDDFFSKGCCKIIVHPYGMSLYTLTFLKFVRDFVPNNNFKNKLALIKHMPKMLIDDIEPGEEKMWYWGRWFSFSKLFSFKKVFYITADPIETHNKRVLGDSSFEALNNKNDYNDIIFSGIVTKKEYFNNGHIKNKILTGILQGIKDATEMIYTDPLLASKILIEYSDAHFNPKQKGWDAGVIYDYLTEAGKNQVYNRTLKIQNQTLQKSKAVYKKFFGLQKLIYPKSKLSYEMSSIVKLNNASFDKDFFNIDDSSSYSYSQSKSPYYHFLEERIKNQNETPPKKFLLYLKLHQIGLIALMPILNSIYVFFFKPRFLIPEHTINLESIYLWTAIFGLTTQSLLFGEIIKQNFKLQFWNIIIGTFILLWSLYTLVDKIEDPNAKWEVMGGLLIPATLAMFNFVSNKKLKGTDFFHFFWLRIKVVTHNIFGFAASEHKTNQEINDDGFVVSFFNKTIFKKTWYFFRNSFSNIRHFVMFEIFNIKKYKKEICNRIEQT